MKSLIFVFIVASLLCLPGCALNGYTGGRPENYLATKQIFDVTFGWNKALNGDGMTIDGYARNNRYFAITELELRVSLVAGDGKEKAKDTFFFIPLELRQAETAPFSITLKASPHAGDMLRFTYRYRFSDDAESSNNGTWMNSFEVNALE